MLEEETLIREEREGAMEDSDGQAGAGREDGARCAVNWRWRL